MGFNAQSSKEKRSGTFFEEFSQLFNKIIDPKQSPGSWTTEAKNKLALINQNIIGLIEKSKTAPDEKIFHKIQLLSQFSMDLLNAFYFSNIRNGEKITSVENEINKYQTIHDIANYCVKTKTKAKIPLAVQMMDLALKDEKGLIQLLSQSELIDQFKQQQYQYKVMQKEPNSMELLRGLLSRYQLDEAMLKTPKLR